MISFHGGPAHGKTLMIRRVPFFLRVVSRAVTNGLELDALDQLADTPSLNESIHVYLRQPGTKANAIHLNLRGKSGSGWYARGSYKLSPVQPAEEVYMRDALAWQNWCKRRAEAQWAEPLDETWEAEGWLPMWAAVRSTKEIRVRTVDGAIHEPVHFAQDLSGEEQPPFSGWFKPSGSGYAEVENVKAWMPLAATPVS
jgi:hypothetical protein